MKICKKCGKEFKPHDKTSQFCSSDCYHEYVRETSRIPSVWDLIDSFKELKNFTQVSKKYNISDNGLRK